MTPQDVSVTSSAHTVMAARTRMAVGANLSVLLSIVVCSWTLSSLPGILGANPSTRTSTPRGAANFSDDAIERLSRVFGIEKVPVQRFHHSPPEYMLYLYNTVAYSDGISRRANPYDADVVRGIPDKVPYRQMHFLFNVSHVPVDEEGVLHAEFHLFKLRSRPPDSSGGPRARRAPHVVLIKVYQVLTKDGGYSPENMRLLSRRRISGHAHGWQVFNVTDSVRQWVNGTHANHGFLVTATRSEGEPINGSSLRFAQRHEHHESKQPVLITFTDKQRQGGLPYNDQDADRKTGDDKAVNSMRKNYVQFLNEGFRAEHGSFLSTRRHYMTPSMHRQLIMDTRRSPSRRSRSSQRVKRSRRAMDYYKYKQSRNKRSCNRRELYVDFDEIGWSGWIISPKGYNAYHCKGECPFPLGQNQKPTNHATVQSIVHALRIGKDVGMPCCVPNKLYSISLLYFDDEENVILKQYDEMVASGCGCQ